MKAIFFIIIFTGCSALDNFEVPMCNGAGLDTCPDGVCVAGRCTTKCEVDEDCPSFCCKETDADYSACADESECR